MKFLTNTIKRLTLWLVQGIVGLCVLAMLVVFVADYTAGCGQTYTDSTGTVHAVAKNSECIFIKHHGKE